MAGLTMMRGPVGPASAADRLATVHGWRRSFLLLLGLLLAAEAGCTREPAGGEQPTEICGNQLDDDGDGFTDEGCISGCDDVGGGCECTVELCNDQLDNDCDGQTDEGCVPGCDDVGGGCECVTEVCSDQLDNDCDGDTDEGCIPGCDDVGPVCNCATEVCGDNLDNDCDGETDEGCVPGCDDVDGCECSGTPKVLLIGGPATGTTSPKTCESSPCPERGHWLGRWFEIYGIELVEWEGTRITDAGLRIDGITQVWVIPPDGSAYYISDESMEGLIAFAEAGGSLVLLTDNLPFISVSDELAAHWGVTYARSDLADVGDMSKFDGTLQEHCVVADIEVINGGVTPSHIQLPDGATTVGEKWGTTLMAVYEPGNARLVFDSAFTRYYAFTEGMALARWVRNVAYYSVCGCDARAPQEPSCDNVAAQCAGEYYAPCTCAASDPCGWADDGICDATECADDIGVSFPDSQDCS